jgi:hypothetical protein
MEYPNHGALFPGGGDAKRPDPSAQSSVDDLRHIIDRQNLVLQTLLVLMIEKGLIQESEFDEWLKHHDGLDGHKDGKLRPSASPRHCSKCDRMNSPTAVKCTYCDAEFQNLYLDPRLRDRS